MDKTTTSARRVKHNVAVDFGGLQLTGSLHHDDERRDLALLTDEGPEGISVDLGAYGLQAAPGRVYIKDWSEHSGLAARLQQAGLIEITGSVTVGPFASTAYEAEVVL